MPQSLKKTIMAEGHIHQSFDGHVDDRYYSVANRQLVRSTVTVVCHNITPLHKLRFFKIVGNANPSQNALWHNHRFRQL